ncbi:MAG: hypothetical protein ABJO02_18695 [Reichenbachiella sp.]|uniref:hypothetical protein n=1 Tax=Reichenbachiella sp. TaxID=2184521 RepID=UPI003297D6E3
MKHTFYIIFLFLIFSCESSDFISIPQDYSQSSYDYNSSSDYFDDRDRLSHQSTNRGSLDLFLSEDQMSMTIYPRLGWSYELTFDNLVEHTLSDGTSATSFRIVRSGQYLSNAISDDDNEFRVNGTTNITLADGNSSLGTFDGLIYADGTIQFEFESVNLKSGEYVITTIRGFPI